MTTALNNIQIVLVRTLYAGNIGSVARAMKNMGIFRLTLADPGCTIDDESMRMATHARDVLVKAKVVKDIGNPVKKSGYIFGSTSRSRKWRSSVSPAVMARKVATLIRNNQVSLLFGPEDMGLSNHELELCHEVVAIPTAAGGGSLNLAQAVMVLCYEIYCATLEKVECEPIRLAPSQEIEKMYAHMRSALLEIGYLNPQNPDHIMGRFRRILTRAGLQLEDVKLIRGIFRQLLWYVQRNSLHGPVQK